MARALLTPPHLYLGPLVQEQFHSETCPLPIGLLEGPCRTRSHGFPPDSFPAPLESDILVPGSALPARLLLPEPLRPPVPHVLAGLALCCLSFPGTE